MSTKLVTNLRNGAALLVSAGGVFGAVQLIAGQIVGEATFCFLILVSVFTGILIALSARVKTFDLGLGKLTMVLSEVKEAQREIEGREQRIKEIATVSADVVAHIAAFAGRLGGVDTHKLNRLWLESRFRRLAALTDKPVGGAAWRFIEKIKNLDADNPEDEARMLNAWEEAYADIRKEVGHDCISPAHPKVR